MTRTLLSGIAALAFAAPAFAQTTIAQANDPWFTAAQETIAAHKAAVPNTKRAKTHCRLHGPLHRTAKTDAALQLLGNVFGYQLGINLGLANLYNIQANVTTDTLGKVDPQLFDVLTLLTDDQPRTTSIDRYAGAASWTLNHNAADCSLL